PMVVLRPFNTYGPRQSARAIIPTIISQALAGDTLRLGSLHPRRDLTFVRDTAAGMIAAATAPGAVGQTIQLGTGEAVSVGEIVTLVGELVGKELRPVLDEARVRPRNSEVELLLSEPTRAAELLGWQPQVALREGLERTIEWVTLNMSRYRADEYVI
ncbi:MAG: GDP-mannose 4,6-dehydratase, partial [Solirubrobacteraceae bacterium]